jgi:hypothetical protein
MKIHVALQNDSVKPRASAGDREIRAGVPPNLEKNARARVHAAIKYPI